MPVSTYGTFGWQISTLTFSRRVPSAAEKGQGPRNDVAVGLGMVDYSAPALQSTRILRHDDLNMWQTAARAKKNGKGRQLGIAMRCNEPYRLATALAGGHLCGLAGVLVGSRLYDMNKGKSRIRGRPFRLIHTLPHGTQVRAHCPNSMRPPPPQCGSTADSQWDAVRSATPRTRRSPRLRIFSLSRIVGVHALIFVPVAGASAAFN